MIVSAFIPNRRETPGRVRARPHLRRWLLALLALALVACGANPAPPETPTPVSTETSLPSSPSPASPTLTPAEMPSVNVDRITYVSPEGDLFTINADGSGSQRLTGSLQARNGPIGGFMAQSLDYETIYAWPTWSRDGTRLAASLVRFGNDRSTEVSVQVVDATNGRHRTVYENDLGRLIADGTPHYLHWSPDSNSLGILATTPQGLSLLLADLATPGWLKTLETGAPLYFNWSGDGNALLTHVGAEVKLLRRPFDPVSATVLTSSGGFRVPAFSAEGGQLAYAEVGPEGGQLQVAAVQQPTETHSALAVGANSAFLWSPRRAELAVADQSNPNSLIFERLRVVSAAGGDERTLVEEPLIAFYWSPDGEKLAWVALDTESQVFQWRVIGREGGEPTDLFRFHPTGEVLTMLSFFDQYAHSHSPWSPDSSHLVVAGTLEPASERRDGHTPTGARIYVMDVTGQEPPQGIASGGLAFWSWN